jgi:hypothetical protein
MKGPTLYIICIAHEVNAKYVLLMALYSYLLGFDGSRKNVIFLYIF